MHARAAVAGCVWPAPAGIPCSAGRRRGRLRHALTPPPTPAFLAQWRGRHRCADRGPGLCQGRQLPPLPLSRQGQRVPAAAQGCQPPRLSTPPAAARTATSLYTAVRRCVSNEGSPPGVLVVGQPCPAALPPFFRPRRCVSRNLRPACRPEPVCIPPRACTACTKSMRALPTKQVPARCRFGAGAPTMRAPHVHCAAGRRVALLATRNPKPRNAVWVHFFFVTLLMRFMLVFPERGSPPLS